MRIEDLKVHIERAIKQQMESYAEINLYLKNHKFVIVITEGPEVNIKASEVKSAVKEKEVIDVVPRETVEAVKNIKKSVKTNVDIPYLLTLLKDAGKVAKSLDYNSLSEEAIEAISKEFERTTGVLMKSKLLECKVRKGDKHVKSARVV